MSAATNSRNGFKLPCPHCGATEGLAVVLHDLAVKCVDCDEAVTVADLQRIADDALRLIRWLEAAGTV